MEIQWSLVLFTAIAGAGAWMFAFIGLNEFLPRVKETKTIMIGCVAAAVLLAAGGVISVTHLSHVEHVMWVLQHPAPGIFLEAMLIGVDAILAIVYYLLVKREASETARKAVAALAVAMGPIFTFSCGSSYMMSSQLSWNNIALPLGYMGTAVPLGAAAWLLLLYVQKESDEAKVLAGWELLAGGVASLVLAAAFGFVSGAAMGSQAALFWLAVIAIGSAVPIACGYLVTKNPGKSLELGAAGAACGLVGSVSYRALMWMVSAALMSLFGVSI